MRPVFVHILHSLVMLTLMWSNRAASDSLECCLDDLVECFEDYFRKSLIVIFVGIGIIVGLLCYLLKMVSERPVPNSPINVPVNATHPKNEVKEISCKRVEQMVNEINKLEENEDMNTDNIDNKKITFDTDLKNKILDIETHQAMKTLNLPTSSSFDENLLREVGFSDCSKHACCCSSNTQVHTASRVPVPSLSTSSSKHKLTAGLRKRPLNKRNLPPLQIGPNMKQGSCGSVCCLDEPKGGFI